MGGGWIFNVNKMTFGGYIRCISGWIFSGVQVNKVVVERRLQDNVWHGSHSSQVQFMENVDQWD